MVRLASSDLFGFGWVGPGHQMTKNQMSARRQNSENYNEPSIYYFYFFSKCVLSMCLSKIWTLFIINKQVVITVQPQLSLCVHG